MSAALPADLPADLPTDLREVLPDVHVVRLPMATRFRGITEREVMLVRGPAGWAEFSPFVEYGTEEASRWFAASLEFAGITRAPHATATAATGSVTSTVAVNATLPACDPGDVERILARFGTVSTVKAKVAERGISSLPEDLERLREFRRLFPDVILRLDANTGYTLAEARDACRAFAGFGLQYFEQPVVAVEDMARLRERLAADGLPIVLAADESIRKASDPLRVAQLGAAEVIIVKVQPLGGVASALEVIRESGLPAVVSSALESSVGLVAGAQLATMLPRTERSLELLGESPACGLGTASFFTEDVVAHGLIPVGGRIPATRIAPDPQRLEALAVDPGRFEWWVERAQACWDLLRTRGALGLGV